MPRCANLCFICGSVFFRVFRVFRGSLPLSACVCRLFSRRLNKPAEAQVDVLAATGLFGVDGNRVFARLDRSEGFFIERLGNVVGDVAAGGEGLDAVEINLGVFIVVNVEGEAVELTAGQLDRAAEPDVGCFPGRADSAAGRG